MDSVAILYPREERVGSEALSLYMLQHGLRELKISSKIYYFGDAIEDLSKYDAVMVSCHYENNYPLVLQMLEKGGMSILRRERTLPVIMGGPVTVNPYPMYNFVDYFVIGDGDNIMPALVEYLENSEKHTIPEWLFAPRLKEHALTNICALEHKHPISMNSKSFFLEIERGCSFSCLFCLIGWTKKPVRHRTLDEIKLIASKTHNFKNYEKVMLVGSDIFSNPEINEILEFLAERGVKISVPSIRIDQIEKFGDVLKKARIESITIAPENSERVRIALGKRFDNDQVYNSVEILERVGVERVKLYFMIGVPFEKDEDVDECIQIVKKCRKLFDGKVSCTFSIFVPKAHTPLQYAPLVSIDTLERRNKKIRKMFGKSAHLTNPKKARIQAWLSIGNREISKILATTYPRGLNYSAWLKEAKKQGVGLKKYEEEKNPEFGFEFESIGTGMGKKTLYKIYERYKKELAG